MKDGSDFGIIGDSLLMQGLRALIVKIAPSNVPVLIQGATGAGKELVAQGIHLASGREGRCVAVNVCALPEGTVEAALFGHVRGGFTGAVADAPGYLAEAHGGTLFLDEIGELPAYLQPKLLRAIETRRFRPVGARTDRSSDFRVVAATNEDLDVLVRRRRFRLDLLFRLRGAVLRVPALAEHAEDIPQLARWIFEQLAASGTRCEITRDALAVLWGYQWPGNVRQLRQVLECAALLSRDGCIGRHEVNAALGELNAAGTIVPDVERRRLLQALEATEWDTGLAARALGIHRATVYRRMERLGVVPPQRHRVRFALIRANSHGADANSATKVIPVGG